MIVFLTVLHEGGSGGIFVGIIFCMIFIAILAAMTAAGVFLYRIHMVCKTFPS